MAETADGDSELHWRSVYENSPEGAMLTAPDGRILRANAHACAMLGRGEAELREVGRSAVAVMDAAATRFLEERQRTGRARGVLTLVRKDGTTFFADVSSAVFSGRDGQLLTSMSLSDVTERERSRRALEILADAGRVLAGSLDPETTLGNLTRLVVPGLADACVVDLVVDGEVRRVAISHRDPARVGAFVGVRRTTPLADAQGGVDLVLRTGSATVQQVTDAWLRTVTHDEAHFQQARALAIRSFISTPLSAHGRTIGALTLMSDGGVPPYTDADLPFVGALGERAALALDNARQYADAVAARRLRDEVLGAVSHDLRGPLNAILLQAQVLARRVSGPEVAGITEAVRRADRLIDDLLLAAKLEGGTLPLDRRKESVASLLNETAELHRALATHKHQSLTVAAPSGDCSVSADRHRIVQLLSNLLGNAIKFTPEGGTISISAAQRPGSVVVEVADSGPGIRREDLPRVFDRFWQAAGGHAGGAGLGLAIAKGIAEAHGGSLAVDSGPGRGATFTLRLPGPAALAGS